MGKNLKGKELGKGIRQRKDGRYEARAVVEGINISIIKSSLKECLEEFKQNFDGVIDKLLSHNSDDYIDYVNR